MIDVTAIRDRYAAVSPHLDERGRRSFAAAEARSARYGGIVAVARATGIAASTIDRGLKEPAFGSDLPAWRVRRPGGGRKTLAATNPTLLDDLMALVSPTERGDPMSPLRWTCKSLRRLAAELRARGHKISHTVVGEVLKQEKFSLQANRKTREGESHPDRDAQFAHINARVTQALAERQPVISVDTKKKELVGDFKNAGREWRPQGDPEDVRVHFCGRARPGARGYRRDRSPATCCWASRDLDFPDRTVERMESYYGCSRETCRCVGGNHRRQTRRPCAGAGYAAGRGRRPAIHHRPARRIRQGSVVRHAPPG